MELKTSEYSRLYKQVFPSIILPRRPSGYESYEYFNIYGIIMHNRGFVNAFVILKTKVPLSFHKTYIYNKHLLFIH